LYPSPHDKQRCAANRFIRSSKPVSPQDNTGIVLWSHHGWHLGEKQHWGKWAGCKRATKVPLILVPPKNNAPVDRRTIQKRGG
jgi:arylsulfatase A-like enzyme